MRCTDHCPVPGGGLLRTLFGLVALFATLAGAVYIVGNPTGNAVGDVVFQATVGVVAAGFTIRYGAMAGRALYEHLRSPAERRKYYELIRRPSAVPAAVTSHAPIALPAAPVKVESRRYAPEGVIRDRPA